MGSGADHTLEFLLDFNGRIHHLEEGYWIKIRNQKGEGKEKSAAWVVVFVHASRARRHAIGWLR
jgi:hypothetical protein